MFVAHQKRSPHRDNSWRQTKNFGNFEQFCFNCSKNCDWKQSRKFVLKNGVWWNGHRRGTKCKLNNKFATYLYVWKENETRIYVWMAFLVFQELCASEWYSLLIRMGICRGGLIDSGRVMQSQDCIMDNNICIFLKRVRACVSVCCVSECIHVEMQTKELYFAPFWPFWPKSNCEYPVSYVCVFLCLVHSNYSIGSDIPESKYIYMSVYTLFVFIECCVGVIVIYCYYHRDWIMHIYI